MIKERAIDAGALGGAAALVVAAWWMAGQIHDHPMSAPIARPAATVTLTQAPAPVAAPSPRRTPAPSPSTSGPTPTATAVSVLDRTVAMPRTSTGGASHEEARPPSAPSPSLAASCSGNVLAVQLLRAACVSVGGTADDR